MARERPGAGSHDAVGLRGRTPAVWAGEAGVRWTIGLEARLRSDAPARADRDLADRDLADRDLADRGLADRGLADLLLATGPGRPVAVVRTADAAGDRVRVAAEHAHVDGLGLLGLLGRELGADVTSSARGVGDRPAAPFARSVVTRLREVVRHPPAVPALPPVPPRAPGAPPGAGPAPDALAAREVEGRVGTAALVVAATQGLLALQRRRGGRTEDVAVAVGLSRRPGSQPDVADHSALLRLTGAEHLTLADVRALLAGAPVTPTAPPGPVDGAAGGRAVARGLALGTRLLSRRLGSTVLVSHLGDLTGPVASVRFHPVTGGAGGLALGAATVDGRTTLTARARGGPGRADVLEELLEDVRAHL